MVEKKESSLAYYNYAKLTDVEYHKSLRFYTRSITLKQCLADLSHESPVPNGKDNTLQEEDCTTESLSGYIRPFFVKPKVLLDHIYQHSYRSCRLSNLQSN